MTLTANKLHLLLPLCIISLSGCVDSSGPDLVRSYEKMAPTIVWVSPYEKPQPSLNEILYSIKHKKKLKPRRFKALYRGGSAITLRKDGVFLTAAHVVRRSSLVRVETMDGHIYQAAVLARNVDLDLALLKLVSKPRERFSPVKIGKQRPLGTHVYAIGLPASMRWVMTTGILSCFDEGQYISDTLADYGSSGGGLFAADDDSLVGVVVQIYKTYSASVTTNNIIDFLDISLPLTKGKSHAI